MGDERRPGVAGTVFEDIALTDSLVDALEDRVMALEEIVAARGIGRLRAARRLGRSLRASIRHLPGRSFAERRSEAASTEWTSAQLAVGKRSELAERHCEPRQLRSSDDG